MDQRQDHWVTKNGEDESVLVVVRHISLGNAQLAASDVGSAFAKVCRKGMQGAVGREGIFYSHRA